jgi:hypothetical protein
MLFYTFCFLAAVAFGGFFLHSRQRNGYGMTYAGVLTLMWLALAAWAGGYIHG